MGEVLWTHNGSTKHANSALAFVHVRHVWGKGRRVHELRRGVASDWREGRWRDMTAGEGEGEGEAALLSEQYQGIQG